MESLVISWVYSFVVWGSGLGWRSNLKSLSVLEAKSGRSNRGQVRCLAMGHPSVYSWRGGRKRGPRGRGECVRMRSVSGEQRMLWVVTYDEVQEVQK